MARDRKKKERKKLKETKVGKFLLEKAPNLIGDGLTIIGDLTGRETLENLGRKISGSNELSEDERSHALELLELDLKEMEEITERWALDAGSESWLPRNIRPLTLAFLLLFMAVIIVTDSIDHWRFEVKPDYIEMIRLLLEISIIAYFGGRSVDKFFKNKK